MTDSPPEIIANDERLLEEWLKQEMEKTIDFGMKVACVTGGHTLTVAELLEREWQSMVPSNNQFGS